MGLLFGNYKNENPLFNLSKKRGVSKEENRVFARRPNVGYPEDYTAVIDLTQGPGLI